MTPVTQTPPEFHWVTMSPSQILYTIKGNVWIRARTSMAQAIQMCHRISFSCDVPIRLAMGFALVARTLFSRTVSFLFLAATHTVLGGISIQKKRQAS